MSNLNALFSTSSKTSGNRASANRASTSSASSASTTIPPRLTSQSSFDSDDSITPLPSIRARNDDGII